ncbi:nitrate- and nitrite sensing domain-containing protein [Streptomyces sp. DH37]|uniref:nitrate- and nitrite sensing domain-containing protein n=1 Tax=Streptomyces sp. DH37 TaxID=3040122 RepID=UPI0024425300|nr:nitrate- and nitrite sensing domain-containing protein [Streptomyces sp. DH37]MDG9702289.1 nitrate- and nitrite sensing domain-containing protein [Streptomyces sp. DH37]
MGKKRHRSSRQDHQDGTAPTPPPTGRRARVRNRLLASVVLCAAAVLAAGAPGVATASRDLTDSQRLVDRAGLGRGAVSLSHALADERDAVVRYIAAGRTTHDGEGLTERERARVDRGIRELSADAPADVRRLLDAFPDTRRRAVAGESGAVETHEAYTQLIQSLNSITAATTRALPARAENATADALPDLGRAVEQASAARGLLLSALAAQGEQPRLTAAAQQAHLREQAALADFDQTALASDRDAYARTVTGTDVTLAERYLARLTDQPRLDHQDRSLDRDRVESALTARVDRMRSMESSLAAAEVKRLERLRDDDLTALELRIALLGVCLLLTVGISVQTARSMARPLAVLRRGGERVAADPVGEEPVAYTGRNDEFADVVRAVNRLRETAAALHERAVRAEAAAGSAAAPAHPASADPRAADPRAADPARETAAELAAVRERLTALAAEHERLLREHEAVKAAAGAAGSDAAEGTGGERPESRQGAPHGTYVHLALRTLGLVERQLTLIESMEHEEKEPDRLATLFKLDHLATRMRRHSENLLLLAGAEHTTGHLEPVPLLDVLRAAISEIERYERVEIAALPPHAQVSGSAADDVSHLIAELVDNATAFSPPDAEVRLSGWMLENGEIMLSVEDEGIGAAPERLAELNAKLAEGASADPEDGDVLGMGLYVVARLAARHGVRVQLREQKQGGIAAVAVLPRALLPDRPMPGAAAGPKAAAAGTVPALPGTVAEANGNALPPRPDRVRPEPAGDAPAPGAGTADAAETARIPRITERTARPAPAAGAGSPAGAAAADVAADVAEAAADPARDALVRAAGPYYIEPDDPREHSRARDETPVPAPGTVPAPTPAPTSAPAPEGEPAPRTVTAKGLPKRTPRTVETGVDVPRHRTGGLRAEELRRRLGGFQQGARDGQRDAEAQIAAEENGGGPGGTPNGTGRSEGRAGSTDTGGTVEEARK